MTSLRVLGAMHRSLRWMSEYIACNRGPRVEFGRLAVAAPAAQFVLVDDVEGN